MRVSLLPFAMQSGSMSSIWNRWGSISGGTRLSQPRRGGGGSWIRDEYEGIVKCSFCLSPTQ